MLLHRKGKKLKILAFDTCLDKTYITLSEDNNIIHSETILSDGKNYHSAYLISTIVKVLKDAGEYGVRGANGAIVIKTGK